MNRNNRTLPFLNYSIGTLFLFLAIVIHIAASWLIREFTDLNIGTILFHLYVPLEGTNMTPFVKIILRCIIFGSLLTFTGLLAAVKCVSDRRLVFRIYRFQLAIPLDFWHRFYLPICGLLLISSVLLNTKTLGFDDFLRNQTTYSSFFAGLLLCNRRRLDSF